MLKSLFFVKIYFRIMRGIITYNNALIDIKSNMN